MSVSSQKIGTRRNHQFDLIRIVFATLVLLSHAPELTDGNRSRELFSGITAGAMSFGEFAVDGFFLLSGFLIVQSWQRDPALFSFIRKRVLRIVPGYVVAVLVSVGIVGVVAPSSPGFFHLLHLKFFESVVLLSSPDTPAVFPGEPYHLVNGALWTIKKEFLCYLTVALFGILGLVQRKMFWLATTVVLLLILSNYFQNPYPERNWIYSHTGIASPFFRLTSSFYLGGCFYLFRRYIRFRATYAVLILAAILLVRLALPHHLETFIILGGGYLLFYLGSLSLPCLSWMNRIPDISYGIYLYGWPVECLWIWYFHTSPWITFVVSSFVCFLLGGLSWRYIERPALSFKRRPALLNPVTKAIDPSHTI